MRNKFFLMAILSFVLCSMLRVPCRASDTSNFRIEILPITPPAETSVVFKGMAAPSSFVTLLKDGAISASTQAGPDANFEITLTGLSAGVYMFTLYGDDIDGRRTNSLAFAISVTSGVTTQISGIFLSPTIDVDKDEVARGDIVSVFGKSKPLVNVSVYFDSIWNTPTSGLTVADDSGLWLYNLDTSSMEYGDYGAKARASVGNGGSISDLSPKVDFEVKEVSKKKKERACPGRADLNTDCKVNIVDMSILAYWWGRGLTDLAKKNVDERLKKDGIIDIRDLSVMAYYWTG